MFNRRSTICEIFFTNLIRLPNNEKTECFKNIFMSLEYFYKPLNK